MRSKQSALLLFAVLFLTGFAGGQGQRELQRVEAIPVPALPAEPIMGTLKCGHDGNIYLRLLVDSQNLLQNPVVRISRDGKRTARFSLSGVSGLEKSGILDFAPDAHGNVYLLATDGGEADRFYLLTFDEAGTFVSKSKLQSGISPYQLAVFSSGEFLISGRELEKTTGVPVPGKAFTGIFDSHGQLLKRVELPGDIGSKATGTSSGASATEQKEYNRALMFSTAESSDNGRIYLARFGTGSVPIFSITPIGEATPIKVKLTNEAYLSSVKVDGNTLAVMSVRKQDPKKARIDEVILSVWSLDTGEALEEFYHSSAALGAALACYKPGLFTFVRASDDGRHLQLVQASAR